MRIFVDFAGILLIEKRPPLIAEAALTFLKTAY